MDERDFEPISLGRILYKVDVYLGHNDYDGAERLLLYWMGEAKAQGDKRSEYSLHNELMGLYRKLAREDDAIGHARRALELIDELQFTDSVSGATGYVNTATVYKAFGRAAEALPIFERAMKIYEEQLPGDDPRLSAMYNNMALALIDLARWDEAEMYFRKALRIQAMLENGAADAAITWLNMADMEFIKAGHIWEGNPRIAEYVDTAEELLDMEDVRHDGHYAFVCEKCAPVFRMYGREDAADRFAAAAQKIYEGD